MNNKNGHLFPDIYCCRVRCPHLFIILKGGNIYILTFLLLLKSDINHDCETMFVMMNRDVELQNLVKVKVVTIDGNENQV